jgi:recyclin-1
MSNFKKVPVSGGLPRRDVLASLKMASMAILVPVLPAGMLTALTRLLTSTSSAEANVMQN